jgi:hypothetical protein
MRGVTEVDLSAAARRLWRLPRCLWHEEMARLLARAHAADRYRKRLGRVHPFWGDGSLAAAVHLEGPPPDQPFLSDPAFLEAFAEAIHAVLSWRCRQDMKLL